VIRAVDSRARAVTSDSWSVAWTTAMPSPVVLGPGGSQSIIEAASSGRPQARASHSV
jgi:hypothetical protein